jgi:fructose-6-phosphate aldolase 2
MIYILDTADLNAIKHCNEFYPLAGVTTNPSIIAREKADFWKLVKEIRAIIGEGKMLHVQTTQKTADKIVEEAVLLQKELGGEFYVKIPIGEEGLKATMKLKELGIGVTMTAIFTQQQALIAAVAGADYVAPYVNRLDNIVSDGVNVVSEIIDIFNSYKLPTKVLAASFKTVEQVHKCALVGTHAITVNPDLFESLIFHPLTNTAINSFSTDWINVYGERKVSELLKD